MREEEEEEQIYERRRRRRRRQRAGVEGRGLCMLTECDRDRAVPRVRGRDRGRRGRVQSGDGDRTLRQRQLGRSA